VRTLRCLAATSRRSIAATELLARALHRGTSNADQLERVGKHDRVGGDERGELAERMPCNADDIGQARGLQHPERRDVAREQRRLDELGRPESFLVAATVGDRSSERVGRRVEHRRAGRMRGPSVGHAEELRALSREQDRRRHRRSL
jgi:hypothetical protein